MSQGQVRNVMGAKSEFAFFKRPRVKLEKGKIRGNFPLKKPQKQKARNA